MKQLGAISAFFIAAALFLTGADARSIHGSSGGFNNGGAQVNLGDKDLAGGAALNILNSFQSQNFQTGTTPADLDANGFPNTTLAAGINGFVWLPSAYAGAGSDFVLKWPASCSLSFIINTNTTTSLIVNASVTGGSNSALNVETSSSAGRIEFQFNSYPGTGFGFAFMPGFANSCAPGGLALIRKSDEIAYDLGQRWAPEFSSKLQAARPATLRPLGWNNSGDRNLNSNVQWRYRTTNSSLSWFNSQFPPRAWGGAITGTTALTISPALDSPADWTAGEVIQGKMVSNNTTTTPTLTITGHTGSKTIVNAGGLALSVGEMFSPSSPPFTTGLVTFVYDAVLDQVIYSVDGITPSVPFEQQIALANSVHSNLWINVAPWADNDYILQLGTIVRNTLNPAVKAIFEYGNEVWNPGYNVTPWASLRGRALGFTIGDARDYHGWYGLRFREAMNILTPIFATQPSRLRGALMNWQATDTTAAVLYRMKGADLAPSGVSTGQGNALYCTYTGGTFSGSCSGGANYTASPNRPIDAAESTGYAPYMGGTNLCTGPDGISCSTTTDNAPFYQCLVNAVEGFSTAGCPSSTPAGLVDYDLNQGRTKVFTVTSCSGTTVTTSGTHGYAANVDNVAFQVTGGTSCSGLVANQLYQVSGTTSNTLTVKAYVNGIVSGSNVTVGSTGSGTTTVGLSNVINLLYSANTYMKIWEGVAASFDGDRPGGVANLRNDWYEGGLEPSGITAAQCTAIGITGVSAAQCEADVATAITAWFNSPLAATTVQNYYGAFTGTYAAMVPTFGLMLHSKYPANLAFTGIIESPVPVLGPFSGNNIWSLLSSDISTTPRQTYYGFGAFPCTGCQNFLLKRDLDPASNDNDPMWLEKAA